MIFNKNYIFIIKKGDIMKNLIIFALVLILSACSNFDFDSKENLAPKLAITYAAGKFIELDEAPNIRAQRVIDVANDVKTLFNESSVTILQIEKSLMKRVQDSDLSASDRLLAESLIIVVSQEIKTRLEKQLLNESEKIKVNQVLSIVENTARAYL